LEKGGGSRAFWKIAVSTRKREVLRTAGKFLLGQRICAGQIKSLREDPCQRGERGGLEKGKTEFGGKEGQTALLGNKVLPCWFSLVAELTDPRRGGVMEKTTSTFIRNRGARSKLSGDTFKERVLPE